ncbi:hypothetical protein GARC_3996 [Paraglaciecola arctica BSs20135]|uniref:Uncharacterized protein n=1 Tax=Paraglaciecola arctica BSs20135 TaxID=493475 RepID=K6YW46_9ALTE|nr:hypothetical protein GARC_3996 [Paraglaciecola arctica BSs20135]
MAFFCGWKLIIKYKATFIGWLLGLGALENGYEFKDIKSRIT